MRLAAVTLGADERLEQRVRHAGGEGENAGRRVAVVPLHDEERQQGEHGARTQIGAAVPQGEREQRGAGGGSTDRRRRSSGVEAARVSAAGRDPAHQLHLSSARRIG